MDDLSEKMVEAAKRGEKETVLALIGQGCDVNYKTAWHKNTALTEAAIFGHSDVVTLLLDRGAIIDDVDSEGRTAFIRASMYSRRDCMSILRDRGARVSAKDKYKMRALDYAVLYNSTLATEWLLAAMGLDGEEYAPAVHPDDQVIVEDG